MLLGRFSSSKIPQTSDRVKSRRSLVLLMTITHIDLVLRLLHGNFVVFTLQHLDLVGRRSAERQHDRQEAEAVEDAEDNNEEVHAEVVESEERRRGEGKDEDAKKLGRCNTDND